MTDTLIIVGLVVGGVAFHLFAWAMASRLLLLHVTWINGRYLPADRNDMAFAALMSFFWPAAFLIFGSQWLVSKYIVPFMAKTAWRGIEFDEVDR